MEMSSSAFTLQALQQKSTAELEALFRQAPSRPWVPALYRGHYLVAIDSAREHPLVKQAITEVGFHYTPFWVDNKRQLWAFFHPAIAAGRYHASLGASRWRDTECYRLDYSKSSLPGMIKGQLYDEVKPLSDDLCLGIGGFNADKGEGEYFFFALYRS